MIRRPAPPGAEACSPSLAEALLAGVREGLHAARSNQPGTLLRCLERLRATAGEEARRRGDTDAGVGSVLSAVEAILGDGTRPAQFESAFSVEVAGTLLEYLERTVAPMLERAAPAVAPEAEVEPRAPLPAPGAPLGSDELRLVRPTRSFDAPLLDGPRAPLAGRATGRDTPTWRQGRERARLTLGRSTHRTGTSRLGEILVEQGKLEKSQLQRALVDQRTSGDRLGTILLRQAWIQAADLRAALDVQRDRTEGASPNVLHAQR